MSKPQPNRVYLWGFGRVLRRLRAHTPLKELSVATEVPQAALTSIEAGRVPTDERTARDLLARGLGLRPRDIDRLVLGVKLYDLGLRENDLRQLVIDLLLRSAPPPIRTEVGRLYRSYAS